MKKKIVIGLVTLVMCAGTAMAQDNTPAYNWGYTYGTQGNNQCGTENKNGRGENRKLEDCNRGYVDGYNATHKSGN